jgi:hypothetical protein
VWSGLRVGSGRLCVEPFGSGQREIVCGAVWEWATGDCVWSALRVGNRKLCVERFGVATGDCLFSGLRVCNGRLCVEQFGSGQREIVCGAV